MKAVGLCFLMLLSAAAYGRDSAYQALRLIGNQKGQDLLNHVTEVEGRSGAPQPTLWRVVVEDSSARGGIREFEVSKGKIISEHAPIRSYSGAHGGTVMDFQKLNLDSEGAFAIADREAKKANVGFDRVDYTLRTGDGAAAPVWVLQLFDSSAGRVGSVHIAADSGTVVEREGLRHTTASRESSRETTTVITRRDSQSDRDYTRNYDDVPPPPPPPPSDTDSEDYANRHNLGHEIDKHLHRVGATLQQFFTGRRTLDRRFQDEP